MFKPNLALSVNCIENLGLSDGVYRYRIHPEFENRLIDLKNQGITAVELCGFGEYAWEFEKFSIQACELAKKHGIKINSIHYPFGFHWLDLNSRWESDRQQIIKWIAKTFTALDKYDIRAYVFHPTPMVSIDESYYREGMARLCDTVDRIAEYTSAYVCIENMVSKFMSTLDECVDYINGSKKGQMVVDVNHFLLDDPAKAILALGNRVKTLHISDNDGIKERHWLPLEGKIDFKSVISALEKVGYDGLFCYEVNDSYTAKQVKENYEKLFK